MIKAKLIFHHSAHPTPRAARARGNNKIPSTVRTAFLFAAPTVPSKEKLPNFYRNEITVKPCQIISTPFDSNYFNF